MSVQTCETCGAAIVWCLTKNDKRQPVDVDPVANGNIKIMEEPDGTLRSIVVKPGSEPNLRISHHATCPDAKQWKGKYNQGG